MTSQHVGIVSHLFLTGSDLKAVTNDNAFVSDIYLLFGYCRMHGPSPLLLYAVRLLYSCTTGQPYAASINRFFFPLPIVAVARINILVLSLQVDFGDDDRIHRHDAAPFM